MCALLTIVSGRFVKIVQAEDQDVVLKRCAPDRPAARFNRAGQDALYLSPDETSARVAIGGYVTETSRRRLLLTFDLDESRLLDLRHPEASDIYELARQPWQQAIADGRDPPSWTAADTVRERGYDGLVDPSRRRPGLWHVTLFHWNADGAPQVRPVGTSTSILLEPDFR